MTLLGTIGLSCYLDLTNNLGSKNKYKHLLQDLKVLTSTRCCVCKGFYAHYVHLNTMNLSKY